MTLEEIVAGESWACRFKTTTFVNNEGKPVQAQLNIGQAHPGKPGTYEGLGVIEVRDTEKRLVQVYDVESHQRFTVNFDDCWDVDRVDWTDE